MADELGQGAPMGAPQEGAPAQGGGDPEATLEGMVSSIDGMIGQLAQLLGQADPALGEAMGQVSQQFRAVIEQVAGAGGQEAPAQAPVPAQAGAGEVVPAF
jgi:hypothetical protein